MLLAFALQAAGLRPDIEESLVKQLSAIAESNSVVYLQSYDAKPEQKTKYRFTFLDSKAAVKGEVSTTEWLRDTQISPDGTMVATRTETYTSGGKPSELTDILVVAKSGLIAKTRVLGMCEMKWVGGSLIVNSYPDNRQLTRFGPDPELGGWSTKKLLDTNTTSMLVEGSSFWIPIYSQDKNKCSLSLMQLDGKISKSLDVDIHCSVQLKPIEIPYLLVSRFHWVGDGIGGYDSLSVKNLDTGTEQPLAKEVEMNQLVWLSGPGMFGFMPSHAARGQMAFYSPTTGQSFTLGPGDMHMPMCAALDNETAIVLGGLNSGKRAIFKMKPGKKTLERITIASVPDPSDVYACR